MKFSQAVLVAVAGSTALVAAAPAAPRNFEEGLEARDVEVEQVVRDFQDELAARGLSVAYTQLEIRTGGNGQHHCPKKKCGSLKPDCFSKGHVVVCEQHPDTWHPPKKECVQCKGDEKRQQQAERKQKQAEKEQKPTERKQKKAERKQKKAEKKQEQAEKKKKPRDLTEMELFVRALEEALDAREFQDALDARSLEDDLVTREVEVEQVVRDFEDELAARGLAISYDQLQIRGNGQHHCPKKNCGSLKPNCFNKGHVVVCEQHPDTWHPPKKECVQCKADAKRQEQANKKA